MENFDAEQMSQADRLAMNIQFLNEAYRKGDPATSDWHYDNMVEELRALEPNHPLLQKGIIEEAKNTPRKRKLQSLMMSLDKVKTLAEIKAWLKSIGLKPSDQVVVTPKYNGVSLEVNFAYGTASTRGDGEYGQNCDKHFEFIHGKMSHDFRELVIGEAIISRDNWAEHFEGKISPKGLPYKLNNATVAGLLNQDEPTPALSLVDFVAYGIVTEAEDYDKENQLRVINLHMVNRVDYCVFSVEDLTEDAIDKAYRASNMQYPCDGLVIDVNDSDARFLLGRQPNGNPAYARALKLDKWVEEYPTVIQNHETQISKQGKLKGVVKFDPILIDGTEVKQASFYNAKFIKDFCLYKGVNITVKKSGEIIPKIMSVEGITIPRVEDFKKVSEFEAAYETARVAIRSTIFNARKEFDLMRREPDYDFNFYFSECPSCGHDLHWDKNQVDLECDNPSCDSMLVSKLEHFFQAIGVEEFGRPSIQTLYDAGYVTPVDIFSIGVENMALLEGFGEASAKIVCDQFDKFYETGLPLARLMYAYDVFEGKIGEKTAQAILDGLGESYFHNQFTVEELIKIKGVSTITAECFLRGLGIYRTLPIITMVSYTQTPPKIALGSKFEFFQVCFSNIRDKELESYIQEQGGKVVDNVSKSTTHLVVADVDQNTSKTVKAREYGCTIISLEDFKQL